MQDMRGKVKRKLAVYVSERVQTESPEPRAEVLDDGGDSVGTVTSGAHSWLLGKPIAMLSIQTSAEGKPCQIGGVQFLPVTENI